MLHIVFLYLMHVTIIFNFIYYLIILSTMSDFCILSSKGLSEVTVLQDMLPNFLNFV